MDINLMHGDCLNIMDELIKQNIKIVYKMENICMKSCFYGIIKLIKKEVENNRT